MIFFACKVYFYINLYAQVLGINTPILMTALIWVLIVYIIIFHKICKDKVHWFFIFLRLNGWTKMFVLFGITLGAGHALPHSPRIPFR